MRVTEDRLTRSAACLTRLAGWLRTTCRFSNQRSTVAIKRGEERGLVSGYGCRIVEDSNNLVISVVESRHTTQCSIDPLETEGVTVNG